MQRRSLRGHTRRPDQSAEFDQRSLGDASGRKSGAVLYRRRLAMKLVWDQKICPSEDECKERVRNEPLKCQGVGRDKDHARALQFYFSRPVSDDEMRYLREVMQRAVACRPLTSGERGT